MVTETEGLLIGGGDLNIHLKPKLHSSCGKSYDRKSLYKKVKLLFEEVGLIDIWRDLFFFNRRDYTHYSASHSLYTRIDYFITFGKDKDRIHTCGIGTIDVSDHALIITVDFDLRFKNYTWKLNSSLLNNPSIKAQIKSEISLFLEFNNNGEVSPSVLWDALKAVLKGRIIAISLFYTTLYSEVPGGSVTQIDSFLNSLDLPVLDEGQNKTMTEDITKKELAVAISWLQLGKSPGSDGYTAELYKEF